MNVRRCCLGVAQHRRFFHVTGGMVLGVYALPQGHASGNRHAQVYIYMSYRPQCGRWLEPH